MEDTIVAIASPAGDGGIGIVRISGEKSRDILLDIFVPASRKDKFEIEPRKLVYGNIVDPQTKETIDEVLAVYMPSPATYTREDIVEIDCHGGTIPMAKVLHLILDQGARLAEPGEFTKRAFLNGRIDLSQAEAVLDVINAKTDDSLNVAINQLQGKFSEEIATIRKKITDILVDIDVNIDYPDEDIEELTYNKLESELADVQKELESLLESAKTGKILRDGLNIAIIGKPNAGKSSLLNLLLRESRAIVTDIPGTTRDTIEEFANIMGIPVKLTDTAGIRETTDRIELIGIEKSKKSLEDADLTILMIDVSEPFDEELKNLIAEVNPKNTLLIFNKIDKDMVISKMDAEGIIQNSGNPFVEHLTCSLLNKADIKKIEEAIFRMSGYDPLSLDNHQRKKGSAIVTNMRHRTMIESAVKSIKDGLNGVMAALPLEIIEIDVRNAYEHLGFITGESVQEDIIEEIFSRFCLGK